MADLSIEIGGTRFKNPVMAAGATPTLTVHNMRRCIERAGAIEWKSVARTSCPNVGSIRVTDSSTVRVTRHADYLGNGLHHSSGLLSNCVRSSRLRRRGTCGLFRTWLLRTSWICAGSGPHRLSALERCCASSPGM